MAFVVYLPKRAARSSIDRPLCLKFCCNCEMLKVGAGKLVVSLALDVLPSFLPLDTSQVGPPDCEINPKI